MDLESMSIETFECLVAKSELHKLLDEGIDAIKEKKSKIIFRSLS